MTDQYKQWTRYRKEIKFLLNLINYEIKNGEYSMGIVGDYFSEATIKEMEEKEPFEGME